MPEISCAPRFPVTLLAVAALTSASAAQAAEPGTDPVPDAVRALSGCWSGTGQVMGKSVAIRLAGRAILLDALFAVDVDSHARDDATDRYAAHLLFGAGEPAKNDPTPPPTAPRPLSGFWADSFGGRFTATGAGNTRPDGFDIVYRYPDAQYINRWRLNGPDLRWDIAAQDAAGQEKPFARYTLAKIACPAPSPRP